MTSFERMVFMAYTLLHEEIVLPGEDIGAPDVVVYYNNEVHQFLVHFPETGKKSFVKTSTLYGNYKYSSELIVKIVPEAANPSNELVILLTNSARNAIHLFCSMNRNLY